jgi:7-keto-8-aminopelargonate synthetase-like enzyme
VPAGTSRLRIALSAAHTEEQMAALRRALDTLGFESCASP